MPSNVTSQPNDSFGYTVLYALKESGNTVDYQMFDDAASSSVAILSGDKFIVSRTGETYQTYGLGRQYIRLDGPTFFGSQSIKNADETYTITVTKKKGDKTSTRKLNLTLLEKPTDATQLKPLSDASQFKNVNWRQVPLDSSYVTGNNLTFSVTPNPDNFFNIKFFNEIPTTVSMPEGVNGDSAQYQFFGTDFGIAYLPSEN
jgi:hypothetical protein